MSTHGGSGLTSGLLSHGASKCNMENRSFESGPGIGSMHVPRKSAKKSGRNGVPMQDASMSTMRTLGALNTNDRGPSGTLRSTELNHRPYDTGVPKCNVNISNGGFMDN